MVDPKLFIERYERKTGKRYNLEADNYTFQNPGSVSFQVSVGTIRLIHNIVWNGPAGTYQLNIKSEKKPYTMNLSNLVGYLFGVYEASGTVDIEFIGPAGSVLTLEWLDIIPDC